jgi:hypothetical protein
VASKKYYIDKCITIIHKKAQYVKNFHTMPIVAQTIQQTLWLNNKKKVWFSNRELTVPLLGATGALGPGCCASSVRRFFSAAKKRNKR